MWITNWYVEVRTLIIGRTIGWLDARDAIEDWKADPMTDRVSAAWERLGAEMVQGLA